jgi:hypothetical protein
MEVESCVGGTVSARADSTSLRESPDGIEFPSHIVDEARKSASIRQRSLDGVVTGLMRQELARSASQALSSTGALSSSLISSGLPATIVMTSSISFDSFAT